MKIHESLVKTPGIEKMAIEADKGIPITYVSVGNAEGSMKGPGKNPIYFSWLG